MFYLFNQASSKDNANTDIWLTKSGTPVFASEVSHSFTPTQNGTLRVGSIDADKADAYQLSKNGQLTETGTNYCDIMGVDKSHHSLAKFVKNSKRTEVQLDAVLPTLENV